MRFIDVINEDSYSDGLPKGFSPKNQVWRTVGFREYGKSGGKKIPGGYHRVRIDKPTGTITSGMFKGVNIDDLHSNAKKFKKLGVKSKNGEKLATNKEIVHKNKDKANLKNLSKRDKERLKDTQHSKRDIDKKISKIDSYLKKNTPKRKGINKERDKEIENLKQQRKALLQARGSSSVASAYTAGVSTFDKKKNKSTVSNYHKEREEYSKGANSAKKRYRSIRDSRPQPKELRSRKR